MILFVLVLILVMVWVWFGSVTDLLRLGLDCPFIDVSNIE